MISFAQINTVSYLDGKDKLEGFFFKAEKPNSKNIGIIVLPAWMGIDNHAKESAEALSKLGYHAFVADIYGSVNNPKNTEEAGKLAGYFKNNPEVYQKRIQLAIDQLVKLGTNKNEIAVIGYCFGGTGAIEAARGNLNVKGIVSFHGGLGKDKMRTTVPITAKVLVLHGADDPYVPQKDIDAFVKFCKYVPCKVNIIEYNPIDDGEFQQASNEALENYINTLERNRIVVNVRRSRGKDIDAACGQLANKN